MVRTLKYIATLAALLVVGCTDSEPPVVFRSGPAETDTLVLETIDTFYLVDTLIDTLELTDTLYLRDTTDFQAIDLLTVGYDFAKRELMDEATSGGLYFDTIGFCTWQAQIHSSPGCDFFKVYGKVYTIGGNIPRGEKRFVAWIRYDGDGSTADSANWDLFDMEWR